MAQRTRTRVQKKMEKLHGRLEQANKRHRKRILELTDDYQTRIRAEKNRHAAEVAKIREQVRD